MAEQPEMKDSGAGNAGEARGSNETTGCLFNVSLPLPQHPTLTPNKPFNNNLCTFFLGNEANLRLQNQSQNNFAELECVQETSRSLTGSDFSVERTVFLQIQAYTPHVGEDNKHSFSCSQSSRRKFPFCDRRYFFFVARFPSPFLGFPFPRSFFRRSCSSLKS